MRESNYQKQSTLSKTDTFGVGTKCRSKSDVRLIESQITGVKKGRDRFSKVSVKREKPLGTDGEVADTGGVRGSVPDTSP